MAAEPESQVEHAVEEEDLDQQQVCVAFRSALSPAGTACIPPAHKLTGSSLILLRLQALELYMPIALVKKRRYVCRKNTD
jgi:hypothetical protein